MQEYLSALEDLRSASDLDDVQRELSRATAGATDADAQPETARVRRALSAMAADFERGRALADAYTALANLYIATGVDLVSPNVDISDLSKLTTIVRAALQPWEHGELPAPPPPPPATAAVPADKGQQTASLSSLFPIR
jgi:hypothetical protein